MNQVINIPGGFELKKVSETEYKIVPKERRLPKTWEEFCEMKKEIEDSERYITSCSTITIPNNDEVWTRRVNSDKNLCPSEEVAEGILALIQLIQLRNYYNNGWKPVKGDYGHTIYFEAYEDILCESTFLSTSFFTFKSADLAKEFYNNFKGLLDKVKYLF